MRKLPIQKVIAILLAMFFLGGTSASAGHYSWGGGYYGGYYGGEVGIVLGGPLWWPSWYYPPINYPEFSSPPVYIERSDSVPATAPSDVWFYCPQSKSYYPYIRECPGGWQTVPSQPPDMTGR